MSDYGISDFPLELLRCIEGGNRPDGYPRDITGTVMYVIDNALDRSEKDIVLARYLGKMTVGDCAERFGVSEDYIRETEHTAIDKMRTSPWRNCLWSGITEYMSREAERIKAKLEDIARAYSDPDIISAVTAGAEANLKIPLYPGASHAIAPDNKSEASIRSITLEELYYRGELPVRALNCLNRADKKTLGDIADMDYNGFLKVRNLGKASYMATLEVLDRYGLKRPSHEAPASDNGE